MNAGCDDKRGREGQAAAPVVAVELGHPQRTDNTILSRQGNVRS